MSDGQDTTYLGDAVYATFDGSRIELKLNDHRSPTLIYLEPEVMQALIDFWSSCTAPALASRRGS